VVDAGQGSNESIHVTVKVSAFFLDLLNCL